MVEKSDLRAVLQYIPQFRGKVFCVLIEADLLPEPAVAETLLDLAVLEDLGVKLVLGVLGGDLKDLYDWTLECEIMAARVTLPISDELAAKEVKDILNRGQSAIIDASGIGPLDIEVVDFAKRIGVSKVIALLQQGILVNGQPAHAIRAADVPDVLKSENVEGRELLAAAANACNLGVPRVHVLNGRQQGVLVDELFSNALCVAQNSLLGPTKIFKHASAITALCLSMITSLVVLPCMNIHQKTARKLPVSMSSKPTKVAAMDLNSSNMRSLSQNKKESLEWLF